MKIKTSNVHAQNGHLNFPNVGKKKVKNGIVDLPDEIAALMVKGDDWTYEDGSSEIAGAEDEIVNTSSKNSMNENDEEEDENEEDENEEEEETTPVKKVAKEKGDELDNMDLKGLIEIAKGASLKNWSKFKNNEKALRTYIRNQLKK